MRPQPTFSFVSSLIFLKIVATSRTATSPWSTSQPRRGRALERLEHLQVDGQVGVGVVVDVDLADVGLLLVPVEAVDVVLLAAVHVDRLVVDEQRRRRAVDLADDARLRALLDDDEVVDGRRAQADALGREGLGHPVVAAAGLHEHALVGEQLEQLGASPAPNSSPSSNGSSNAAHFRWLMRTSRLSGSTRPASGDVSKRYSGCDATYWLSGDDDATSTANDEPVAAARAADLLPGARERARVAGEHRRIEPADVDAQLERVRRDDAADAPVAQAALDGAPLVRQIAAAVALDLRRLADALLQRLAQVAEQQLDAHARRREDDRLHARAAAAARRSPARRPTALSRMPSSRFTTGGL